MRKSGVGALFAGGMYESQALATGGRSRRRGTHRIPPRNENAPGRTLRDSSSRRWDDANHPEDPTMNRRLRHCRLATLAPLGFLLAAAVLGACTAAPGAGGGSGGGGSAGGGEAGSLAGGNCGLVTQSEVQSAVDGMGLDWRVGPGVPDGADCAFDVQGSTQGEVGTVIVGRESGTSRGSYDDVKTAFDGVEVSGLGDAAFWAENVKLLGVLDGSSYLTVQVVIFRGDGQRDAAIQLATIALGRS